MRRTPPGYSWTFSPMLARKRVGSAATIASTLSRRVCRLCGSASHVHPGLGRAAQESRGTDQDIATDVLRQSGPVVVKVKDVVERAHVMRVRNDDHEGSPTTPRDSGGPGRGASAPPDVVAHQ